MTEPEPKATILDEIDRRVRMFPITVASLSLLFGTLIGSVASPGEPGVMFWVLFWLSAALMLVGAVTGK